MENASYALQIAASVLIAVMVIALIVYVFNSLSTYQDNQDEIATRESITEFNEAFEAYAKNLMYGTDVLSCLNKAENNNQKYVYSIYYGTDTSSITWEARETYIVNVSVTIATELEESVVVYVKENGKLSEQTKSECTNLNIKFKAFSSSNSDGFDVPTVTFYYFTGDTSKEQTINKKTEDYLDLMGVSLNRSSWTLTTDTFSTDFDEGTYELVPSSNPSSSEIEESGMLAALLSTVTEPEQTIYKSNYTEGTGWYSATWTTAVNDFKTRKFHCTDISYNETTGYVDSITFVEHVSSKDEDTSKCDTYCYDW